MKTKTIFLLFILSIIFISCSKNSAKNNPENVLKELSQTDKVIEKRQFYSGATLKVINNAVSKGLIAENERKNILNDLNDNIEWEIVKSDISSDKSSKKAHIIIKYTEHPIENMIGFRMQYNFIIEDGKWKIDMKNEVEEAIALVKKSDHGKYLDNIRTNNTIK